MICLSIVEQSSLISGKMNTTCYKTTEIYFRFDKSIMLWRAEHLDHPEFLATSTENKPSVGVTPSLKYVASAYWNLFLMFSISKESFPASPSNPNPLCL